MVRRLLTIGIDEYKSPRNNLNSCVNDAKTVEALLHDQYGFTDIRRMYNADASLDNVRSHLDWLVSGCTPEDRLVYYHSSHGARIPVGPIVEEVLVMHDEQFLFDNELSERTQGLPPGVLTCWFDTCHSGGMDKLVMFTDGQLELVRGKVWIPDEPLSMTLANRTDIQVKLFAAPVTNEAASLEKGFAPGAGDGERSLAKSVDDEQGQVEMNGLLVSAALAEETALAATSRTSGLSVFTFYMIEALKRLGRERSAVELRAEADRQIKAVGYRQTPVVKAPSRTPDLGGQIFIAMSSISSTKGKEGNMTTTTVQPDVAAEEQEKLFGAIAGVLAPTLIRAGGRLLGRAIRGRRKGVGEEADIADVDAVPDEEAEKFFRGLLRTVSRVVIPTVARVLQGQPKSVDGIPVVTDEEMTEKFIGPILARLGPALAQVLPSLLPAIPGQKAILPQDIVNDPDASEKLGELLGGITGPIIRCTPRVITALGGRISPTMASGPAKGLDDSDALTLKDFVAPLD